MSRTISALLFLMFSTLASAYSVTIEQTVDGHDNLFYTDWGHWFTQAGDNGVNAAGSQAASSIPFNFGGLSSISITASGAVTQDLDTAFDPNGACVASCDSILFPNGDFRAPGLTAYSLIGIWSRSATEIDPFYTGDQGWRDIESGLGLLLIGSTRDLMVPDFNAAYLFLAVNDGGFADNSGHYDVRVTASVPEPGALFLLVTGLFCLWLARRRVY
jgi:hypothetical protein